MKPLRLLCLVLLLLGAGSALTACGSTSPPDLTGLQKALATGHFTGVMLQGATPAAATKDYAQVTAGLDASRPTVSIATAQVSGQTASAPVHWSWRIEGHTWAYDTAVTATKDGSAWRVDWSPALIAPGLKRGDVLQAKDIEPRRGDIIGAGGVRLMTDRPVTVFGIDKSQVPAAQAEASATRLARLLDLDPAPYAKLVKDAGPKQWVPAITFRRGEAPAEAGHIGSIKGARMITTTEPLAPYKGYASPLLGEVGPVTAELLKKNPGVYRAGDVVGLTGLEQRYDTRLRGKPGLEIDRVGHGHTASLLRVRATPGKPLRLTLVDRLQRLAESLLDHVGPASALVAIRPSTGAVLAAANGPGADGLELATYGQEPPGSTFKMFDSLALLRKGLTPESPVHCTPTAMVDGKRFSNDQWYPSADLGTVPLKTAVAQSCNTAMINARGQLTDVASAAATLGFGIDHDTGFPAYFGQIPKPASETEQAADLIGQGKVLASPLVMATAMASIEAGHTVVPQMVGGVKASVPSSVKPLTRHEDAELKTIFRQVVLTGTGEGLRDVPGAPVIAKTGTAEFGPTGHTMTHAWMVAAQGDLAVAVFINTGQTGAGTAGPILKAFLERAQ